MDVMRLPPESLVAFAAVFEYGGVTAAADHLRLTQPAVSNRLKSLETFAEAPLYRRAGGRLVLTEAGERLLPHARAVARSLERATSAMNESVGPICVTVGVCEAAVPFVVPRLARLTEQMPDCDIQVVHEEGTSVAQAVTVGRVDFGVTAAGPDDGGDHLERRALLVDEIVVAMAIDDPHPGLVVQLPDLAEATILWQSRSSGVRCTVDRALEEAGISPRRSIETGSAQAALSATAAGLGWCFVARTFAAPWQQAQSVRLCSLENPDFYAHIELVTPPVATLSRTQRAIVEALYPHSGRELVSV